MERLLVITWLDLIIPNSAPAYFSSFTNKQIISTQSKLFLLLAGECHFLQVSNLE